MTIGTGVLVATTAGVVLATTVEIEDGFDSGVDFGANDRTVAAAGVGFDEAAGLGVETTTAGFAGAGVATAFDVGSGAGLGIDMVAGFGGPVITVGFGTATVGFGTATVGFGTDTVGLGTATVGFGTETVGRWIVGLGTLTRGTVGLGTEIVGRGTAIFGFGILTAGTVGRGTLMVTAPTGEAAPKTVSPAMMPATSLTFRMTSPPSWRLFAPLTGIPRMNPETAWTIAGGGVPGKP